MRRLRGSWTSEVRQAIAGRLQVVRGGLAARGVDVGLEVAPRLLTVVLQRVGPAQREDGLTQARHEPQRRLELLDGGVVVALLLVDRAEQVMQVLTNAPPGADFDAWVAQARELAEARRRSG